MIIKEINLDEKSIGQNNTDADFISACVCVCGGRVCVRESKRQGVYNSVCVREWEGVLREVGVFLKGCFLTLLII